MKSVKKGLIVAALVLSGISGRHWVYRAPQENPRVVFAATSPLTLSLAKLPAATVGVPYSTTLQLTINGGLAPYSWFLNPPPYPAWMQIWPSPAPGTFFIMAGTPKVAGTYTFTVNVTDQTMPTALKATGTAVLTVKPAPAAKKAPKKKT